MLFEELTDKIIVITDEVEQLIDSKNEELCSSLLAQRQNYLIQLSKSIEIGNESVSNKERLNQYHHFLQNLQRRDNQYTERLNLQKVQVLKDLKQQVTGSKAVSAYKKVIID